MDRFLSIDAISVPNVILCHKKICKSLKIDAL